jgi:PTH1 family peptidyl-tRNA hydrolase
MAQRFLIVGLGNPGPEYFHTRHNIGFRVLDELAGGPEAFRPARLADVAETSHHGRKLLLVKPNTYMNLSGKAVLYWLSQEKLGPEQLLVVTDDLALPFGTLRLRAKGSDGGHNGLKDIQAKLGHPNWARLRVGIGAQFAQGQQVDYVLGEFGPPERTQLPTVLQGAAQAVQAWAFNGVAQAMTAWNKDLLAPPKPPKPPRPDTPPPPPST